MTSSPFSPAPVPVPDVAQRLFDYLDGLGLAYETHWHDAVFTVEEGAHIKASIPGGHTKNLFMQDKDGAIVLISAEGHAQLRLNQLHKLIGTRRLSFASAELMQDLLGVSPGSVTGFALMNDSAQRVRFIVSAGLMTHERLNFHPLTNIATTGVARADFETFVAATSHTLETVDFSQL